jgi:hypothetical protein
MLAYKASEDACFEPHLAARGADGSGGLGERLRVSYSSVYLADGRTVHLIVNAR